MRAPGADGEHDHGRGVDGVASHLPTALLQEVLRGRVDAGVELPTGSEVPTDTN